MGGAKNFFESKIKAANKTNKFEEEVCGVLDDLVFYLILLVDQEGARGEEERAGREVKETGRVQEQAGKLCLILSRPGVNGAVLQIALYLTEMTH